MMMKKNLLWMLAAILICGLALVSCTVEDNPANGSGAEPEQTDNNTLPEVSTDYDKMTDWFWAAIKIANPHVQTAWNADVNPADFNMLLVNQEKTRMYLINPTTKKEIPQSEWSEDVKRAVQNTTSFSHVAFNGLNCTIILFIDSYEEMKERMLKMYGEEITLKDYMLKFVALFYHEAFHQYVQIPAKGWKKTAKSEDAGKENRNQDYPIDYMPRAYRKLALLALKAAWENPSQKDKHYSRAKYWTDKYEKTYPQEAAGIKGTDVDEATADFFERNLLHPLFGYKQLHEIEGLYLGSKVDQESYMSSIAIWLAKRDGRLTEAIDNFKQKTLTPINFLLKDVPVPANYDESQDAADMEVVRKTLSQFYGEDNPDIQLVIKAINAHKTGMMTYLVIPCPSNSTASSTSTFNLLELPGYSCATNVTSSTDDYVMDNLTILEYGVFNLIPTTNAGNLTVTGLKNMEAPSPIEPVTVTQEGQLTAVTGIEGFALKKLPMDIFIGKDSYGNTYYMSKEQPKTDTNFSE